MRIDKYSFGKIIINGVEYARDVIIFPERVRSNWWRREGHRLHIEDLEEVIEYNPEILIIGTGAYGAMKVPESVIKELEKKGIHVIVANTREACDKYNELIEKGKKVVAALHLTC